MDNKHGIRLKELRNHKGKTLAEFGEMIGREGGTISGIENGGTLSHKLATKICEVFDVNKDWLMNGEGEMNKGFVSINASIGERIVDLRLKEGITISDLSKKTGIDESILDLYEKGMGTSTSLFKKIADAFGVNYDWLTKGEGEIYLPTKKYNDQLMNALARIEEKWKAENDLLKDILKTLKDTVQSQQSTIAELVSGRSKFKATVLKPLRKSRGLVKQLFSKNELEAIKLQSLMQG